MLEQTQANNTEITVLLEHVENCFSSLLIGFYLFPIFLFVLYHFSLYSKKDKNIENNPFSEVKFVRARILKSLYSFFFLVNFIYRVVYFGYFVVAGFLDMHEFQYIFSGSTFYTLASILLGSIFYEEIGDYKQLWLSFSTRRVLKISFTILCFIFIIYEVLSTIFNITIQSIYGLIPKKLDVVIIIEDIVMVIQSFIQLFFFIALIILFLRKTKKRLLIDEDTVDSDGEQKTGFLDDVKRVLPPEEKKMFMFYSCFMLLISFFRVVLSIFVSFKKAFFDDYMFYFDSYLAQENPILNSIFVMMELFSICLFDLPLFISLFYVWRNDDKDLLNIFPPFLKALCKIPKQLNRY